MFCLCLKWARSRPACFVGLGLALFVVIVLGVAGCKSSQRATSNAARRGDRDSSAYWPKSDRPYREVELASLRVACPEIADAEFINDDELCMTCHKSYVETFQHNIHRGQSCEKCHGAGSRHLQTRGKELGTILSFKTLQPPQRSELCLKCHEQNACSPGNSWRKSPHAHHGVACTDCHTSHYNVPAGTPATQLADADDSLTHQLVAYLQGQPPVDQAVLRTESKKMGALTPQVCYRCHASLAKQQEVAHSHQICGAVGLDCTTCHDPHGKVRPETRTDLCLKCHDQSSPNMAWHSSTHARFGVACADCHNPHPNPSVQAVLNASHTDIRRTPRSPMSVDEPKACYRCHAEVYAKTSMPSHHPIKEGKMLCSDCHDGHGQSQGNLKEPTLNMVCAKCHAEKNGPFTWEHPPVTESCGICHDPHGAVTNNLLHQPTTFLCLRCHTGHRTSPLGPNHSPLLGDVGTSPALQKAFFSDCTQCHSEIHGSDLPTPHLPRALMR